MPIMPADRRPKSDCPAFGALHQVVPAVTGWRRSAAPRRDRSYKAAAVSGLLAVSASVVFGTGAVSASPPSSSGGGADCGQSEDAAGADTGSIDKAKQGKGKSSSDKTAKAKPSTAKSGKAKPTGTNPGKPSASEPAHDAYTVKPCNYIPTDSPQIFPEQGES